MTTKNPNKVSLRVKANSALERYMLSTPGTPTAKLHDLAAFYEAVKITMRHPERA